MNAIDELIFCSHEVFAAVKGQYLTDREDLEPLYDLEVEIRCTLNQALDRGSLTEVRVWRIMRDYVSNVINAAQLNGYADVPVDTAVDFDKWFMRMADALNIATNAELPKPEEPRPSLFQRRR